MEKLVRDKIPSIIENNGEKPIFHIADEEEYASKLLEKLGEECGEFSESLSIEELADVFEVLYAICNLKGVSLDELEEVRSEKADARGEFGERIILDGVE